MIHHNMRPGVAERLGIDYESARELNPSVIYCHTPAYGITGPRASWPGFDQLFQAMCGCEWEAGGEGNGPVWYRFGMCDTGNAFQSVIGVLLALYHRERTGEGQFVDTNLLNCGLYYNSDVYIGPRGPIPAAPASTRRRRGLGPLYRLYQASDGWVAVVCVDEAQWRGLTSVLGREELAGDSTVRYGGGACGACGGAERRAGAVVRVADGGRPGSPPWTAPACRARSATLAPPRRGTTTMTCWRTGWWRRTSTRNTVRCGSSGGSSTSRRRRVRIFGAPPVLGQHTREIMDELGYSVDEARRLREAGVIAWPE